MTTYLIGAACTFVGLVILNELNIWNNYLLDKDDKLKMRIGCFFNGTILAAIWPLTIVVFLMHRIVEALTFFFG